MHKANGGAISQGALVKINALDERTGAVAHADNGNSDFSHGKNEILPAVEGVGQDTKWSWKVKAVNEM
jgi:hypothetical protein